jgi:hypothetical protein
MRSVGVFGSSLPRPGSPPYEAARALGRELARRDARVVCGGYGGVMEAACRGARDCGGRTVGILLEGRGAPNPWVEEAVREPDLAARLTSLRDLSDAWIFLERGLGTMLELVWISESVVKGVTPPRPLVLFGEFWMATVETALGEASSPEGAARLRGAVRRAETARQAASAALEA